MKPQFLEKPWVRAVMIALGIGMMACAYDFFFIPNKIAPGGFSGLGTVLYYQFGFPVGMVTLVLNVPLFLFAFKEQGWGYILRSLAATLGFSLLLDFLPVLYVTDDILLASVYGGGLVGMGLGMVVRAGASTGGSDMLAQLIARKMPRVSFGMALLLIEAVIVGASGLVFGPQSALYAVLVIMLTSKIIDVLQEGVDAAKAFFIISARGEEIGRQVLTLLERGATLLNGTGMYSGENKPVLLCIIHRSETLRLKEIVREIDPAAFMIVTNVHEALGEGFAPMEKTAGKKARRAEK